MQAARRGHWSSVLGQFNSAYIPRPGYAWRTIYETWRTYAMEDGDVDDLTRLLGAADARDGDAVRTVAQAYRRTGRPHPPTWSASS